MKNRKLPVILIAISAILVVFFSFTGSTKSVKHFEFGKGPIGKNPNYLLPYAVRCYDFKIEQYGKANTTDSLIGYDVPTRQITMYAKPKRQETYKGTTNVSGVYNVVFSSAYATTPSIQANIINATDTQNIRTTAVSTTGFTVVVRNRVDVIGLLPTWVNVNGATVDILITEN